MPVIVVGADTEVGKAVVSLLCRQAAEVRAFITDEAAADSLKKQGVKVAVGDVSDHSHVEAAALYCFCAVLVTEAASDGRVRSFVTDPEGVMSGWAEAVLQAGVKRVIWVRTQNDPEKLPGPVGEVASVVFGGDGEETAREVGRLEEAGNL
ncbi:MAG: NAD(P)H-binding protein [Acidimicrobiia bacterium]|nr:NAD(P)H-binding protein [Acidimicrobiia bacterium]